MNKFSTLCYSVLSYSILLDRMEMFLSGFQSGVCILLCFSETAVVVFKFSPIQSLKCFHEHFFICGYPFVGNST